MPTPDPSSTNEIIDAGAIRRLLAEHERSGLSLAAFARAHGVKPYRLYDARRRSRHRSRSRGSRSASFQEVHVKEVPAAPGSVIELLLPAGLVLRMDREFDEVTLRRLLGVLSTC